MRSSARPLLRVRFCTVSRICPPVPIKADKLRSNPCTTVEQMLETMLRPEHLALIRVVMADLTRFSELRALFRTTVSAPAMRYLLALLRPEQRPWRKTVVLVAPASIRTSAVDKLLAHTEKRLGAFPPDGRKYYEGAYRGFVRTFVKMEEEEGGPGVTAEAVYRALRA